MPESARCQKATCPHDRRQSLSEIQLVATHVADRHHRLARKITAPAVFRGQRRLVNPFVTVVPDQASAVEKILLQATQMKEWTCLRRIKSGTEGKCRSAVHRSHLTRFPQPASELTPGNSTRQLEPCEVSELAVVFERAGAESPEPLQAMVRNLKIFRNFCSKNPKFGNPYPCREDQTQRLQVSSSDQTAERKVPAIGCVVLLRHDPTRIKVRQIARSFWQLGVGNYPQRGFFGKKTG